ncbi:MAG: hypothetical protein AAF985_12495 [Bacteroidota bacterium]
MKNKTSLWAYGIACLLILIVAFAYPKWKYKGNVATLSWDVTGYYLYLPAAFLYNDLGQLQFKDQLFETYNPASSFYHAVPLENGNYIMKYPIGLAIQMFPSFVIGGVLAKVMGYPLDGFSYPFQLSISFGSLFVAFIGLWFCRKILLRYFDDQSTALGLLVLAFATNYLNYSAIDGAMTHNFLFTLYALLIWLTIRWYEKPTLKISTAVGAIIGLATITRPVELISVLIPLLWGLNGFSDLPQRLTFWQSHWQKIVAAMLTTIAVGTIQLVYWKWYSGDWLFYSYEDQGFDWKSPHLEAIFSYRKGWLTYTPVMIFAILGLPLLWWRQRSLFWVCSTYFVINLYLVISWSVWWYGGSFGQRALVQSYAMMSIPLTAFIAFIWQSKWWKYPLAAAFIFCAWLNLVQTYQSHADGGGMTPDMMTKAYYWRIFGKIGVPDTDRKLLDTDEDYIGRRADVKKVFRTSYEDYALSDNIRTQHAYTGEKAVFLNYDYKKSPIIEIPKDQLTGKWMRVSAYFFAPWKEWDMWQMPQLIVRYHKDKKVIKSKMIRLHRILPAGQYMEIAMDSVLPEDHFDHAEIEVYMVNSKTHLHVDDLRVETFNES